MMDEMLRLIRSLPDQIQEMLDQDIPPLEPAPTIFLAGMGGSAISGDLLRSALWDQPYRLEVIRDYRLPAYAQKGDLLIASSYSGNTEETLSIFREGTERGLRCAAVTSGGKLAELAESAGAPLVRIPTGYPPRTALGYLFTGLARLLWPLVPEEVQKTLQDLPDFLRKLQERFEGTEAFSFELAETLYLRIPVVYSSTRLFPVAFRWKTQMNENAKAFCHVAELPELDHNEIVGMQNPKERLETFWVIFLQDPEDHPRIRLRIRHTADLIRDSVLGITHIEPEGSSFLHRLFYLVYLGDYVSYYLAKLYKEDPVPVKRIDELKRRLAQ